jgi:hypothetical protein
MKTADAVFMPKEVSEEMRHSLSICLYLEWFHPLYYLAVNHAPVIPYGINLDASADHKPGLGKMLVVHACPP